MRARLSRPRRLRLAAGAALAASVLLSGCAEAALPTPSPRPASEQVPVLSSDQLDAIVTRVLDGVAAADNLRDASELAKVADGPALATRAARYQIVTKNPSLAAPAAIGSEQLQVVVPASQDWPRSVLVVTRRDKSDTLPQLLVLTQRTPRVGYKLSAVVPMLGGATLPFTAPIREGVEVRRSGQGAGVQMAPRAALDLYAAMLAQAKPAGADRIAQSALTTAINNAQNDLRQQLTVACLNCFKVTITDQATGSQWAFDTSDGGTLVLGEVTETATLASQNGFQQALNAEAVALSGQASITKEGTLTQTIMVALVIPPATSKDKISVVAGSDWLTGATAS